MSSSLRVLQHTAPFSSARLHTFPIASLLAVCFFIAFWEGKVFVYLSQLLVFVSKIHSLDSADALIFSPSASPCSAATGYNFGVNFTENEVDMVIYSYHCVCVSLWKNKRGILKVLYYAKITL